MIINFYTYLKITTGCCANALMDSLPRLLATPPALTTLRINSLLTEQQLASDLVSLHSTVSEVCTSVPIMLNNSCFCSNIE